MSEIVTTPGDTVFPDFGLQVISNGPVTLRRPPTSPDGTVEADGSTVGDTIRATLLGADQFRFLLVGLQGDDTLVGGNLADTLQGRGGNDLITGGLGADSIQGGVGRDSIFGENGADVIAGGANTDHIFAGLGNDTVVGGEGDDAIGGGQGNDSLDGGNGNDLMIGGRGSDTIFGGAGNDTIEGRPGADLIITSAGTDLLTGGPGADTFQVAATAAVPDVDTITDFNPQEDRIFLEQAVVGTLPVGTLQDADFASVATISDNTTAAIVYETSTGLIYFNPASGTDVQLLQLQPNLTLTAAAFSVISSTV